MKYIIKFICFIILFAGNITKSQNTSDIFWDVKVPVSTAILAEEQDILILVTNKNEIQFWELSTREYLKTFSEMGSDIISLALSNNGKLLACGGRDNYICVYDIVQKKLINKITVNNKLTTTLLFNIDGTEVITGGYDNLIKKWNISTGKLINSFDAKCPITMIKFNENNDSYICGLFDGTIIEVNSAFTEIIKIIKTGSYLSTFDLSNYGDFIITSGCDEGTSSSTCQNSTVKTWDIRTSQLLSSKTFLTKPLKSFFLFNNNQTLMGLNDITFIKKIFISAGVLGADEIINTGKHKIVNIFKMREESSLIAITEEGKFIFVDNNIMLGAVNFGNQDIIKAKVEKKINEWQKKGKFEKSEDYKKRVNEENRNVKIQQYVAETINELASSKIKIDFSKATNEYDADNEVFKIMFNNL